MRDLIWTVIVIWLAHRLYHLFLKPFLSGKKEQKEFVEEKPETPGEVNLKEASRRLANKEGEYVDFEEVR